MTPSNLPRNQIDRRYHLIHKLGEGLFGEVYLVYDEGEYWALKLLKGELKHLDPAATLSIFKQEFLLLRELRHPGIARIVDFGLDRELGRYYYTSEYIGGADLWEVSENTPYEQMEELFVQALRALGYLHQYGIIHGDIKPENLLVRTEEGPWQLKLIDFGVAVFKDQGKIMGSPTYTAPEIFSGASATPAADLYSLGVVLYTVLSRSNPFRAESLAETVDRQKHFSPLAIHLVNPNVPTYCQHILERLLQKDPALRYSQAAQVIQDLNFVSGKDYALETERSRHAYIPFEHKLLGRAKEYDAFKDAFERLFKAESPDPNAPRFLLISGDRGMGKSRLIAEFKTYAQVNEVAVEQIDGALSADLADRTLFLLPDAEKCPDSTLLDFVRQAMGKRILIAGEAKSGLRQFPATLSLHLAPFTESETEAILREAFHGLPLTAPLLGAVYTSTQGNPLFIQEIIRLLLDEAWQFDQSGKWDEETVLHLYDYLRRADVPGSLSDLLKERLRRLEDRELLAVLALLDRPSSANDLVEILKDESLAHRLFVLSEAGWIARDRETGQWSVANPLLGKQVLAEMKEEERAALEEKIGLVLAKRHGEDPKALYYLSHSPNIDTARQAAEGAYHYHWDREEYEEALAFLNRLLELSQGLPPIQVVRFKMLKSECLSALRQFDAAVALLQSCLEELNSSPLDEENLGQRLECLKKLGTVHLKQNQILEATEAYQTGLAFSSLLKNGAVYKIYFENAKAHVKVQEGQLDAALVTFEKTWPLWEKLGKDEQNMVLNNDLGRTLLMLGRHEAALEQLKVELGHYNREQNSFCAARTYYHLADAHLALKHFDEAVEHYRSGIGIAKAHRTYDLLVRLYNGLGNLYQLRQQFSESIAAYERALRYTRKIRETSAMAGVLTNLGILYQRTGKSHEAFSHLTCAIHLISQLPNRRAYELYCLARSHLELGDYYLDSKEYKKSETHLREALVLCTTHEGIGSLLPWVLERLVRTAMKTGSQSEEISEWFSLWEKADPKVKENPDGPYETLYRKWLSDHGFGPEASDAKPSRVDDATITAFTSELNEIGMGDEKSPERIEEHSLIMSTGDEHFFTWKEFETAYIAQTLFSCRFNITQAAKQLDLTRATLYRKIGEYHLEALDPLSFSINTALRVPLGSSLKKAMYSYLRESLNRYAVDCQQIATRLGVSRNRIDRLLERGKSEGW